MAYRKSGYATIVTSPLLANHILEEASRSLWNVCVWIAISICLSWTKRLSRLSLAPILISTGKPMFFSFTESEDSSRRRHAAEFWGGKEAKQLKKRKAAEQKLEDEENEIARFLSCSVSSLGLSKHDLTDDMCMCGSIDEITKGSAITTALSSADWSLWTAHGSWCGSCSCNCSCSCVFMFWCWLLIATWLLFCLWGWYLQLPSSLRWLFFSVSVAVVMLLYYFSYCLLNSLLLYI